MYRKMTLMQRDTTPEKHLIVNGGEHEPGSAKDQYLLENYPETVIEGALIAASAANAKDVLIAIKESAVKAIDSMKSATDRLALDYRSTEAGQISISHVPVPDSYLVGEETALINVLEGSAALPRRRPPFPIESGFHGKPTLVHNVETVAHLPFIVAAGPDRYRSLGPGGLGVTLCTFGPEFKHAGVRLVPLGITLREVVCHYGGGLRSGHKIKAVQPGGPAAGILSELELDVVFEDQALKTAGSALGCAAIRALSVDDDIVSFVANIMNFFAEGSCGQCPPCRMETQMLSNIMMQVKARKATGKLLDQVPIIVRNAAARPALCGLVHMPARPILTALEKFPDEFARYSATTSA